MPLPACWFAHAQKLVIDTLTAKGYSTVRVSDLDDG